MNSLFKPKDQQLSKRILVLGDSSLHLTSPHLGASGPAASIPTAQILLSVVDKKTMPTVPALSVPSHPIMGFGGYRPTWLVVACNGCHRLPAYKRFRTRPRFQKKCLAFSGNLSAPPKFTSITVRPGITGRFHQGYEHNLLKSSCAE
jgi:hypothetical protein